MFDVVNIMIAVLSAIVLLFVLKSFKLHGMKSYNVFLLMFFFCLLFNTTKLSRLQGDKSLMDIYVFFVGSFFFLFPIYVIEKARLPYLKERGVLNLNILFPILLAIFLLLKIYITMKIGFRLDLLLNENPFMKLEAPTVPGFSGWAMSLQWILVMYSPLIKKKWAAILVVSVVVFSILQVSRGDIMRMCTFYFLYYIFQLVNGKGYNLTKTLKKGLPVILFILIAFIVLGNMRSNVRGKEDYVVVDNLESKISNVGFAWIYSYFVINYDVIRLFYKDIPTNQPNALLDLIKGRDSDDYHDGLNGFNASTFFSRFVRDYQELFWTEVLIFGLIVAFIILLVKMIKANCVYVFICTFLFMSPFGNYLGNRNIFISIILALLFHLFIYIPRNKVSV